MPQIPDNLDRLHRHEEQIRKETVEAISDDDLLADHLGAVHDALDHLTVLLHVESKVGDSAHTIQLLGMRLFNCAASSLKLGLSGYYQVAFQLLRDSLELVNLVDLFRIDLSAVERWKAADDKTLKREFGPAGVRLLLEKHPDFADQRRDHAYATFSGYASHPSYKGFQLIAPNNNPKLGPFLDAKLLRALLEDLGKHISHAALGVGLLLQSEDLRVLRAKAAYLTRLRDYHEKYLKQEGS